MRLGSLQALHCACCVCLFPLHLTLSRTATCNRSDLLRVDNITLAYHFPSLGIQQSVSAPKESTQHVHIQTNMCALSDMPRNKAQAY